MKEFLTIILALSLTRLIGAYVQEEKLLMFQHKTRKVSDLVILIIWIVAYTLGIIFVWQIKGN
jgi:hypothetical protein